MARHTFFSFYYERDVWRAGQVRNSWVTKDRDAAGFWDKAKWAKYSKETESSYSELAEQLADLGI